MSGHSDRFFRRIFFCVAALALSGLPASSLAGDPQKPSPILREYRQRVWTRQHGLPSNAIQAILQTRDGFLWAATRSGLARFDGLRFTVFNRENTPAFKGDECTALAEDQDGNLWIGTTKGLVRLGEGQFSSFTATDGLWDNHISALCATRDGDVWIGTGNGPTRFHKGTFTRFQPRERVVSEKDAMTRVLYEDRNGILWIGSTPGLQRWDRESNSFRNEFLAYAGPVKDVFVKHMAEDSSGNLWIRSQYLRNKDDAEWNDAAQREDLSEREITCLFSDRSGVVWLATKRHGLVQWRERQVVPVAGKNVLPDDEVSCLYEDREGNLWIGTQSGGLVQWLPRRFTIYRQAHGLAHDDVWAVWQRSEGSVWVGTESGLDLLEAGTRASRQPRIRRIDWPTMAASRVHSLCEDSSGTLWIGTGNGLFYLNHQERGELHVPGNEIDNTVRAVLEDRFGSIWVATQTGLHVFRNGERTSFTTAHGLPANDIRALLEDAEGNLWIGTAGGGVCQLPIPDWPEAPVTNSVTSRAAGEDSDPPPGDPEAISRLERRLRASRLFSTKNGLSSDYVTALFRDAEGVLWIGTRRGLNRLQDGHLAAFTMQHGLASDVVSQIVEDDNGQLWVGCEVGIYKMPKRDLRYLAEGRVSKLQCILYDESDGLFSSETNGGRNQPSAIKTRDGLLWFSTSRGLVVIDPRFTCPTEAAPPVYIEQIRANGHAIAFHREWKKEEGGATMQTISGEGDRSSQLRSLHTQMAIRERRRSRK